MTRSLVTLSLSLGVALVAACSVSDVGSTPPDDVDAGPDCRPPGPPPDLNTLTECCSMFGKAHCLPEADVPANLRSRLSSCGTPGLCVPDVFITGGADYQPKSCASLGGEPGVCLSGCIPEVGNAASFLPQDVCEADERCAPCKNPATQESTGACDIAADDTCGGPPPDAGGDGGNAQPACPHTGPDVIDPATFPACGTCGGGHCVPSNLIPDPTLADRLAACDASSLCVPDELIRTGGNFVPMSCQSVGGVEGRCQSSCLPEIAGQADRLPRDRCPETHRCAPCFDPFTGADTGACSLACDAPARPPSTFSRCCESRGSCVPKSVVGERAADLGVDVCPAGTDQVCVPDVYRDGEFQAPACETGLIALLFGAAYKPGACQPGCLPAVANVLIGQDNCTAGFKCAPCLDPLTGMPTGACAP